MSEANKVSVDRLVMRRDASFWRRPGCAYRYHLSRGKTGPLGHHVAACNSRIQLNEGTAVSIDDAWLLVCDRCWAKHNKELSTSDPALPGERKDGETSERSDDSSPAPCSASDRRNERKAYHVATIASSLVWGGEHGWERDEVGEHDLANALRRYVRDLKK